MGERNDAIMALMISYTHPALQAFNEYLAAEKNARAAAEVCGVDADLMIVEAEALAKATTFSNVEALGLVIDRTMNGKRATGEEGRDMSYCKFCGREIDWITSAEGKHVPVDPDPVFVIEDDGPDTFLDDMGAIITGRQARPEEERRDLPVAFVPHRRTCPQADKPAQYRTERGGGYGGLSPAT